MPFNRWYGICLGFGPDPGSSGGFSDEELVLLLLSLLEKGPRHGYELALDLEERSEGGIEADPELVYPLLQLMVDRELISVSTEEEKRLYELTSEGREKVSDSNPRIQRLWRRARRGGWVPGDDGFDTVVGSACESVRWALEEAEQALDEVREGLSGCWAGTRRSRRRRRRPGCC